MINYRQEVNQEAQYKPRLYTYPDSLKSSTVFDDDDRSEDNLLVLCVRANPEEGIDSHQLFIWTGSDFEGGDV